MTRPGDPSPRYEALDTDALARNLADHEWREAPVTEGTTPLTVVDFTRARGRDERATPIIAIPLATPRVFLAIYDNATLASPCDAVVASADADDVIAAISTTCATAPTASTLCVQLLRAGTDRTVAQGLWTESVVYSMLLAGAEFATWLGTRPHRVATGPTTANTLTTTGATSATSAASPAPLHVAHNDDTLTLMLDRPEVHNAYSAAMRDALVDTLRAVLALDDPPTVHLCGRGPSFCSGGDLTEFGVTPDVVSAHAVRTNRSPGLLLHQLGTHTTARVHGACIGAGVELAAFCARVDAAADTTFRLPELAMGLVPGAGGTVSITRRIGRHRTALLALTGRAIDAPTALEWGLIDAVDQVP